MFHTVIAIFKIGFVAHVTFHFFELNFADTNRRNFKHKLVQSNKYLLYCFDRFFVINKIAD